MAVSNTTRSDPNGRTNYQVHRRTSAGWEFRTVYLGMEEAIKEAKRSLELPGTEAVRVVRDDYDPITKMIRPNTVFRAIAEEPVLVKPGFWTKLHSTGDGKTGTRTSMVGRLAASAIGMALGTAVTLLYS